ncbi:SapC family protein [Steroidobacter sp. S1-65]|uniref:SapC family protein n=1 Tax=Steroidobacter gossypii TaxID=2805490 RepID=A0ABS1WZ42_9GAMM|nr:SapC family protein [Steroidobacter gossypii]MBM0106254.1 SapC family protein [Steroidobacter gossypii]
MARHELLNNIAHKDLRVITRHGAEFGDNVATVLTFPTEYGDVQREYPIFFRKDPQTGEFQSIALLGFQQDENLFLDEQGWHAAYIPGIVARGPFLIGFQNKDVDGELRREPVIHVDLDSPRISATEGEPVFLPQGGNTRYLERIGTVLQGIHLGLALSKTMFDAFTAAELIEPVNVEIKFSDEEQFNLRGLYTISEERLRALDGDTLYKLNSAGFLQGAFLVIASLNNVKKLIDMKHRRRRRQAEVATAS